MEARTDFVAGAVARAADFGMMIIAVASVEPCESYVLWSLEHESNIALRVCDVCFDIATVVLLWVYVGFDNPINSIAIETRVQDL